MEVRAICHLCNFGNDSTICNKIIVFENLWINIIFVLSFSIFSHSVHIVNFVGNLNTIHFAWIIVEKYIILDVKHLAH